ncbi:hypothetical protein B0H19DRAFT_1258462 [Mycena capillaripes]|nr:hypothetical protein B0H19DRAFT_1258462 [Mycena capillaripes]
MLYTGKGDMGMHYQPDKGGVQTFFQPNNGGVQAWCRPDKIILYNGRGGPSKRCQAEHKFSVGRPTARCPYCGCTGASTCLVRLWLVTWVHLCRNPIVPALCEAVMASTAE